MDNPTPTDHERETGQQALPTIPIIINTTLNLTAARYFNTLDATCYHPGNVLAQMNQALDTVHTPHIDNVVWEEYHPVTTSPSATNERRARIIIYPGPAYISEQQLVEHLQIIACVQVLINKINMTKPTGKGSDSTTLEEQFTNPYWADNNCSPSLSAFTYTLPAINTPHKLKHVGALGIPSEWGGTHNHLGKIFRLSEIIRGLCRDTMIHDNLTQHEQDILHDYLTYPTKLTEVVGLRHTPLERKHKQSPKHKSPSQRGPNASGSPNKRPSVPSKFTHVGIYVADTPAGDAIHTILSKSATQYSQTQRGRNIASPFPLSVRFLPKHGLELLMFSYTKPSSRDHLSSRDQLYVEVYGFVQRVTQKFGPTVCKVISNMDIRDVNNHNNLTTLATGMGDLICLTPQQKGVNTAIGSSHVVLADNLGTQLLDADDLASSMDIKQHLPPPSSDQTNDPYSTTVLQQRNALLHPHTVATNPTTHHVYVVTWSLYGDVVFITTSWEFVKAITHGVSCSFQCRVNSIDDGLRLLTRHFGYHFETEKDIHHWNNSVPLNTTHQSLHRLPASFQFLRRRARVPLTTVSPPPTIRDRETSESIVFRFSVTTCASRERFLNAHHRNSLGTNFEAAIPTIDFLINRHVHFERPPGDTRLLSEAENSVILTAIIDSGALNDDNFTCNMTSPFFFLSYETNNFEPYDSTLQLMQRHRNPPRPVLPSVGPADHQLPPPEQPIRPPQPPMNTSPPATQAQQQTQQQDGTDDFKLEDLPLEDDEEDLAISESQDEMFANAASTAPPSPKRKSHDDDDPPSSPKRRSTEGTTDVQMEDSSDTAQPLYEQAKGDMTPEEVLFHNNIETYFSNSAQQHMLNFFRELVTPSDIHGKTPAGYYLLLSEVAPITTYTDIRNLLRNMHFTTRSDPPVNIGPFIDTIIHFALICHQGPESNGIPIGPPPPTHAVFVCKKPETYIHLREHLREHNLFGHQNRQNPGRFRYAEFPHQYIPEIEPWETFNTTHDVMWMKENCPRAFHHQLFQRLYTEFNCNTYPKKPFSNMERIKDWFNSIAPAGSGKTVPSLI